MPHERPKARNNGENSNHVVLIPTRLQSCTPWKTIARVSRMKTIDVTAGVVRNGARVLIARRNL